MFASKNEARIASRSNLTTIAKNEAKPTPGNTLFVGALTAALVFMMAARTPLDSDLFWHLRAGEDFLRTLRPVLVDGYSYTRAGEVWINHSWLGQVLLALAYRAGGWTGLSGLVAALAAGSIVLVYQRMSGPPLCRAFLAILAVVVAAPVWSPRPQIFSLFLVVLLDSLLERRSVWWKTAAWTAFIFIGWSNLHGGYVLGMILLACRWAGGLVDRWSGRQVEGNWLPILGPLGLALLGFMAAAINPNGIAMWKIPFQTVGVEQLQNAIPEWASPDFHDPVQQPFLLMLVGVLLAVGLAGRPASGKEMVKTVVFAGMALVARRNFAPFALMAAPLLSASGWDALSRWAARLGWRQVPTPEGRNRRWLNLAIVCLLWLAAGVKLAVVSHPALVESYLQQQYPAAAADYLRANRPEGRLFSTYAWGGYLIWALPEYPVFVDGRTDLYGDDVISEWLAVMAGDDGWEDLLAQREVRLALLEPGQPLVKTMEQAGWHKIFEDETAVVMERNE